MCCPGATHRDANLQQEPAAARGENWALTPGPCQSEGVTRGWMAFAAWKCTLFCLCLASSLFGGLWIESECKPPSHFLSGVARGPLVCFKSTQTWVKLYLHKSVGYQCCLCRGAACHTGSPQQKLAEEREFESQWSVLFWDLYPALTCISYLGLIISTPDIKMHLQHTNFRFLIVWLMLKFQSMSPPLAILTLYNKSNISCTHPSKAYVTN